MSMNLPQAVRQSIEPWRVAVCGSVVVFLALAVATHTFRPYHLFTLAAIPAAVVGSSAGRRFFLEWGPLMATWLAYDRFRLLQSSLLSRVSVAWPYDMDRTLFGWATGGIAPPHAARAFLAAHSGSPVWSATVVTAEVLYVSHIFAYPLLLVLWWWRGRNASVPHARFLRHVFGFAALNVVGFVGYILFPAAPPWWVSLYGLEQPTQALVATANLGAVMDGTIIQHTLATAPNWFAAVPSLHGAYPVLLFLFALRHERRFWLAPIALYGGAVWASTIALNQHYVVDLLTGAVAAAGVFLAVMHAERRGALAALDHDSEP